MVLGCRFALVKHEKRLKSRLLARIAVTGQTGDLPRGK
jgi:hypothetical protein